MIHLTCDQYAGFADRYDLFFEEFGRHSALVEEFFKDLFEEHGTATLLDCACGTGHYLALFQSLGMEVTGSDISPAMLNQARYNLSQLDPGPDLHQADYRHLPRHFRRRFDAVTCLSSSILHMPDDLEVVRAFDSMGSVLQDGGILVLTQGTTDRQWQEKPRFIVGTQRPGFTRLFVIDYLGRGARYNILDLFQHEGRTELMTWSVEYAQVLLMVDHQRLLREAGFKNLEFFGSYSRDPYCPETSSLLITVAQR